MKKFLTLFLLYIIGLNQAFAGIFLSEILPNTTDDSTLEYIQLYNSGSGKIDIEGYQLKDKSGKQYVFGSGEFIDSNSYTKYYRPETKILLNNTNEELYLSDNSGILLDSFSYSTSKKGEKIVIYNTSNSGTINNSLTGTLSNSGTTQTGTLISSGSTTGTGILNNSGPTNTGSLTNSGVLTNSGTTQTGILINNTGSTNSGVTNSGNTIENINLIYEFQNPSYVTDKTVGKEKYTCDNSKDECKLNLNFENSFSGTIKQSDYNCEIDFGLKGWKTGEENKCNPKTITFPKGVFNIKMKIISKDDINIFSEKSFILENKTEVQVQIIEKEKIVYKDKVCSNSSSSSSSSTSSTTNQTTASTQSKPKVNINTPKIKIQSGIVGGKCTKQNCNVNLIYEPENSSIQCLWDFGVGTFKTANTDKKCNPGYVNYPLGNHKITLKVYNKYNLNNFKTTYINFSNQIILKKQKEKIIIDKTTKKVDNTEIAENKEESVEKEDKVDIMDKKDINKTGSGIQKANTEKEIKKSEKITKSETQKDNTENKILKKKLVLPYFMDNYKIPEIENKIIVQGRLGSKILSGSTIKCFDTCSLNFIAKDSDNIKDYFWDFGNGETFKGQNPSYVKYNKTGEYNITLTTFTNSGIKNIEDFKVNYQIKPKITKKKKVAKYKKYKSTTKKTSGVYMTKQKLYSDYIPKKELNLNYVDKNEIGNYCSNIKYFPDTVNKFKVLVLFLIGLVIVLGGFIVMKKRELI